MGCRAPGDGDGAWRAKQVFHPISDCQGAFPYHRTPFHPSFIINGLRARKSCSQQHSKPSWSRAYLWGGEEAWGKMPPGFAGSVPQGG